MTSGKLTLTCIILAGALAAPGLAAHEPGLPETAAEKENYVRENMRKVQAAAEGYASHHQGRYPTKIDNAFHSYFPFGGADDQNFSTLSCIYNPYTHTKELPVVGKVKTVEQARRQKSRRIAEGVTEYSPIENGKSYVILGCGLKGAIVPAGTNGSEGKTPYVLTSSTDLAIRANMLAVQWAAEMYAESHQRFPIAIDDQFKNCFPSQDLAHKGTGLPLRNPFTQKLEWPILGKLKNAREARFTPPGYLKAGVIEYNSIDGGKDYAIRAGGKDGKALMRHHNAKQTLILSKEGDI